MARTKPIEIIPTYEDHQYLFFTIKYDFSTWRNINDIRVIVYIGQRELMQLEKTVYKTPPTQAQLNDWVEDQIFDKLYSAFNNEYARENHEHTFVAR